MQLSVAARNAILNAIEATIGASAKLQLYTGPIPANCAAAATGTKLLEAALPADWMADAANAAAGKLGAWTGNGIAAGNADYYRVVNNAGTVCGIQGLAGKPWSATTIYALNEKAVNGGRLYTCTTAGTSAAAGGPAGTGAGIADGTAVWSYVGDCDLILTNNNITVGQPVTINAFDITAANA